MIVDRAQASHATIRDVGTVFACELVVAGGNHARIISEHREWFVEPVGHQPLDMITVVLNGAIASPLAFHVGIPIALPGLAQRWNCDARLDFVGIGIF